MPAVPSTVRLPADTMRTRAGHLSYLKGIRKMITAEILIDAFILLMKILSAGQII